MTTVLAIDDETRIRSIVRAAVESDGGDAHEAANGSRGIALARDERPPLVVLDLGLPDMDGLEVCRRLPEWPTSPILMLSARPPDEEKAELRDAGADDCLTTPSSTLEPQARVRAPLRRARMGPLPGGDAPVVAPRLTIDLARPTVARDGESVRLTARKPEGDALRPTLIQTEAEVGHRPVLPDS